MQKVNRQLSIRNARLDELDEVAQLLKEAYLEYEHSIPESAWQAYLQNIMDVRSRLKEAELIVAEIDGQLAGAVTLYPKISASSEEGWPEGWTGVRLLGVCPEFQGRGIGRALMDECIRRSREQGASAVGLHTSELMVTAQKMYEKMGFKRIPEFDHHPAPGITVMAYHLDLN